MRQPAVTVMSLALGALLFWGAPALEAAAPSTTPKVNRQTLVFKACSRKRVAEHRKAVEERMRQNRPQTGETKKPKPRD